MERFGRPRMRGSGAPKPYGARLGPSNRSGGLLGPAPHQSSDQYDSYQGYNKPKEWPSRSGNSDGSLLGREPRNPSMRGNSRGGRRSPRSSGSVPSEVQQLMKSLGLSQEDMQRLSQLPENELSVNNLAKAIGNLKRTKDQFDNRGNANSFNSPPQRSDSRRTELFSSRSRGSFSRDEGRGVLGDAPKQQGNFNSRPNQFKDSRSPSDDRSFGNPSGRPKHSNMKVTVKPGEQSLGGRPRMLNSKHDSNFSGRQNFSNKNQRDEFYQDEQFYGRRNADRFDPPRHDLFSQNNRRVNDQKFNVREAGGRNQGFGNERRVERVRESPPGRGPRGSIHRPVGTRNASKSSSLPSLLDLPLSPKNRRGSSSLLGNPRDHSSPGLEKLVAAVGNNSLLTPLMLATQTDPSVLEAQIQAMKALQAQAMKLRSDRPPRRPSPSPPSRSIMHNRRVADEARRESQLMRSARGRVLYIKYKSARVTEKDLRMLASAFGRVTKLLIIKPKVKNGDFQAFMEMHQWDSAAAMLERFMTKPPTIKGFSIQVQRSNYVDLQLKSDLVQSGSKRKRAVSPIRKGTTQLPIKRNRRTDSDGKAKLSITTSRTDRRVVSKPESGKAQDKDKKTDAREILNRSRIARKKEGENNTSQGTTKDGDSVEQSDDGSKEAKTEKSKDDIDPLDALADELALHDEFVLMDEVGYSKKKKADEERKNAALDLDGAELDLDNVKVEEESISAQAERDQLMFNTEEELVASILDDVIRKVENKFFEENEKAEAEKALLMMNYSDDEGSFEGFSVEDNEVQEFVYDNELLAGDQTDDNMETSIDEQLPDDKISDEQQSPLRDNNTPVMDEKEVAHINVIDEQLPDPNENDDAPNLAPSEDKVEDANDFEDNVEDEENRSSSNEQSSQEDEVQKLRQCMTESLVEIQEAKNHLNALVRVTKAKAAQTLAKKLRVCLEAAVCQLEVSDSSS